MIFCRFVALYITLILHFPTVIDLYTCNICFLVGKTDSYFGALMYYLYWYKIVCDLFFCHVHYFLQKGKFKKILDWYSYQTKISRWFITMTNYSNFKAKHDCKIVFNYTTWNFQSNVYQKMVKIRFLQLVVCPNKVINLNNL